MNNKVTITINNAKYAIISPEREEYVQGIAGKVDAEIREILRGGPHVSPLMASVLSSLNFCDRLTKCEETASNLRSQIRMYYEELSQAKTECDAAKKETAALKKELAALKKELAARQEQELTELLEQAPAAE